MSIVYNPHNYQLKAFDHALHNEACGLFLDMGLGKTIIVLTLVEYLIYKELEIDNVLIIAPKKVAENTWSKEVNKWQHTSKLKISKVLGPEKQRKRALAEKADIYVINRENVAWLCAQYGGTTLPFDMIVIDESSSFKNQNSLRFKALKLIMPSIRRKIILTGTPAPNGLVDIWSQIYLLDNGKRLGKFKSNYIDRFFKIDPKTAYSTFPKRILENGADTKIYDLIGDICISMKAEDYLELPPVTYNYVDVYLSEETRKLYEEFEREQIIEFIDEGLEVTALNAAALTNKLLQFSNGAIYYDTQADENGKKKKEWLEIHDDKIDALEELIEEANGQPILIAYMYQHDKERLLKRFKNYGIRMLDTPQDEIDWNNGKIQLLLTHPASSAYGLNLQDGGHICVWFGTTWDLELYQQFNKRLHRQGQLHPVILHHLVSVGTDDMRVITSLQAKEDVQEALLKGLKAKIEKYMRKP